MTQTILASDLKPGMVLRIGEGIAYQIIEVEQVGEFMWVQCQWLHYPLVIHPTTTVVVAI